MTGHSARAEERNAQERVGSKLANIPSRERLGIAFLLGVARRSPVAMVALAMGLAVVLAEMVPWVRNEITKEFPFTISLVAGGLLLVLTVVVVEAYLDELDRRQAVRDRERVELAWEPSADRVKTDIRRAVSGRSGLVIEIRLGLAEAEKQGRKADRSNLVAPIDAAVEEVSRTLNSWLPILLQRDDLTEVARRGEEILGTLTTVSWTSLKEETGSDDLLLEGATQQLAAHEEWFHEEFMRRMDAGLKEIATRINGHSEDAG